MNKENKDKKTNVKKIVKQENVVGAEALFENWEEKRHPFLCRACRIEKGGYINVDFGKEIC